MPEFTILHLFAGIGGGALGFQQATTEYRGAVGRFRTLAGIDVDPEACRDFERLTGAPCHQMDLFTRDDYRAFHGREPGSDWREITPADIHSAAGERPDVVFLSPPCKGFSGLLPSKQAASDKYQALNRLVIRSMRLMLDAFEDDLPGLVLIENVPRITSRGTGLLAEVKRLLGRAGYRFHEGFHDAGQLGGLAQHRRRYLLVARHPAKLPQFVHQPQLYPVRSIGSVLEHLPLPDAPEAGPMHRCPRLSWLTWVRLALIHAGGDWRDLQHIERYGIEPLTHGERYAGSPGLMGVADWDKPIGAVTANASVTSGNATAAVADPRLGHAPRSGVFKIGKWDGPAQAIVGSASVRGSNGMAAIADPRLPPRENRHPAVYRVIRWDDPAACVTGTRFGSGAPAVADPRLNPRENRRSNSHTVRGWNDAACTVTGEDTIGSGAQSIADPRIPFNNVWRVTGWQEPAGAITAGSGPSSSGTCVADPRGDRYLNQMRMLPWDGPANTVTGAEGVHQGAQSVTDPRLTCTPRSGAYRVVGWDDPACTVTGAGDVHSQGAACVADPRIPADNERPDPPPVIIALDGTWHRPLTTLELAALQGFPLTMPDGSPLTLAGKSDSRWRERIGNAVPPPAARAIGQQMLISLMASSDDLILSNTGIWVHPIEERRRYHATAD